MMHICLVIHEISMGGAERIMVELANFWIERRRRVTLITFDDGESQDAYEVDKRIKRVYLGIKGSTVGSVEALRVNVGRIKAVRNAFQSIQPDVVLSFMPETNVLSIIAGRLEKIPIVVSERNNPRKTNLPKMWRILRFLAYPMARTVVVQTNRVRACFAHLGGRCVVIPNFVRNMASLDQIEGETRNQTVIAAGRLTPAKGFDILIQAFAKIAGQFPEWNLEIWGQGSDRDSLQTLIESVGCSDQIALMGVSQKLDVEMRKASVFVLSSRYEGYPNVLCEAMACELPVISTDCVSGPGEVIEHGENGFLVAVDDAGQLARQLVVLMENENLRKELGRVAMKLSTTHHIVQISKMWEEHLFVS